MTARVDGTRTGKDDRLSRTQRAFAEDFQGILNSTGIATLIVDHDLRIFFYSQAAASLFTLSEADLGRPIADVPRRFADPELLLDAQTVISTGVSLRREVKADNGAWYNRRLSPHRTADDEFNSAVLTFADISEMKATEQEIEASRAHSNSIVDAIHQPLVVLDQDLRIVSASPSFYRGFGVTPMSAVGRPLPLLRDGCLDVPALRSFLDRVAAGQDVPDDYEIEIELRPRGRRVLLLNARKILVASSPTQQTLLAIDDITPRKQAEAALEAAKKLAERANLGKSRFLALPRRNGATMRAARRWLVGATEGDGAGRAVRQRRPGAKRRPASRPTAFATWSSDFYWMPMDTPGRAMPMVGP